MSIPIYPILDLLDHRHHSVNGRKLVSSFSRNSFALQVPTFSSPELLVRFFSTSACPFILSSLLAANSPSLFPFLSPEGEELRLLRLRKSALRLRDRLRPSLLPILTSLTGARSPLRLRGEGLRLLPLCWEGDLERFRRLGAGLRLLLEKESLLLRSRPPRGGERLFERELGEPRRLLGGDRLSRAPRRGGERRRGGGLYEGERKRRRLLGGGVKDGERSRLRGLAERELLRFGGDLLLGERPPADERSSEGVRLRGEGDRRLGVAERLRGGGERLGGGDLDREWFGERDLNRR